MSILDISKNSEVHTKYFDCLGQDCSICLEEHDEEDFLAKKIHRTSCNHFFHKECITKWANKQKTCPECTSQLAIETDSKEWEKALTKLAPTVRACLTPKKKELQVKRDEELAQKLEAQEQALAKKQEEERKAQIESDKKLAEALQKAGNLRE